MTLQEKRIWKDICDSIRPGFFKGSEILLRTFVTATAIEQRLAEHVRAIEAAEGCSKRYHEAVRMHAAQARLVGSLSTKLRLSPRSVIDPRSPKLAAWSGPKPWDVLSDDADVDGSA